MDNLEVGPPDINSGRNRRARRIPEPSVLTPREKEILGLLTLGLSNKDIGNRLPNERKPVERITEQTVKNHLHNICIKLGIRGRMTLILYAVHYNLYIRAPKARETAYVA